MRLSFIIPTLNEVAQIDGLQSQLQKLRAQGHEIIVVDGGSQDGTPEKIKSACDRLVLSSRGRARQMNAGARVAGGAVLVFMHADSELPAQAAALIRQAIQQRPWGRFDVALSGKACIYRIIASMMNIRSCISGIATGDQCLFVRKQLFDALGGYAEIPLMEDIAMSRTLKRVSRPVCIKTRLVTSSRRWEQRGIIQTMVLMWYLRLAYFVGVSPQRLHDRYYSR